jgi:hypothetical protein
MSRFSRFWTAGHGLALALLAVFLVGGFVTDGRVRAMAFALVAVWILLGLVVVSLGHAHEAGRLPHHLAFGAVFVVGCVGGSHLWEATTATLPDHIAAGIGVGVWAVASWAGNKLVYAGPFDRVLDRAGDLNG